MKTLNCRYCGGVRPVHEETGQCHGCAMDVADASTNVVKPGEKRPCPICMSDMVHWCEGFSRLKCIPCGTVFRPQDGKVVR